MSLIADIFVTVKPTAERMGVTMRSLRSLLENTKRSEFRLTVCVDGQNTVIGDDSNEFEHLLLEEADYVLTSAENEGLGPTINRAVAHVMSINDWYSDPRAGDPSKVAPYLCMVQDDVLYSRDWLPVLASRFRAYGMTRPLGFASGIECVEHPVREAVADGIVYKDWVRATMMLSTRQYWESMMPIPRFDPETGRVRAKPNDGMGSGVDWWLIRNHENSVCRTGRTNLVMPGLCQHMGYAQSTWLKREMPESDGDKRVVKRLSLPVSISGRPFEVRIPGPIEQLVTLNFFLDGKKFNVIRAELPEPNSDFFDVKLTVKNCETLEESIMGTAGVVWENVRFIPSDGSHSDVYGIERGPSIPLTIEFVEGDD